MTETTSKISKKTQQVQREVFGVIGTASAVLETLPEFVDELNTKFRYGVGSLASSPLMFLFQIMDSLGTSEEEINKWITDIIIDYLPEIETSVKAVLIEELVDIFDCRINLLIPEGLRYENNDGYFTLRGISKALHGDSEQAQHGYVIDIDSIDPDAMLSISPFIDEGKLLYFGQFDHYDSDPLKNSNKDVTNQRETGDNKAKRKTTKEGKDNTPSNADGTRLLKLNTSNTNLNPSNTPNNSIKSVDIHDVQAWLDSKTTNTVKKSDPPSADMVSNENINIVTNSEEIFDCKKEIPRNPFSFIRADDMNAFLWLCIHKHTLPSPMYCTISYAPVGESEKLELEVTGIKYEYASGNTVLNEVPLKKETGNTDKDAAGIVEGNTFVSNTNKSVVQCCYKVDDKGNANIAPISDNWNSYNWYGNRKNYYKRPEKRDVKGIEIPICNVKYMKDEDYVVRNMVKGTNNIIVSVPRAPLVLTYLDFLSNSSITESIKSLYAPIVFDGNGRPNKNGGYTIKREILNFTIAETSGKYLIIPFRSDESIKLVYVNDETYFIGTQRNSTTNPDFVPYFTNGNVEHLVPCYPGLTVQEFNYDYIMSLQLFDPENLVRRLLYEITNASFSIDTVSYTEKSRGEGTDTNTSSIVNQKTKVLNMIEKIIESGGEETDCLFTFNNDDYDAMLKRTDMARYNQIPYSRNNTNSCSISSEDIERIMQFYPVNGTSAEKKSAINELINQASYSIVTNALNNGGLNGESASLDEGDVNTTRKQFSTDILSRICLVLLESLITPKVLLIFEINRQIKDDTGGAARSTTNILDALLNIVVSVAKEIVDKICTKILEYIISELTKMSVPIKIKIEAEQYESYLTILTQLLAFLKSARGKIGDLFGFSGEDNEAINDLLNDEEYKSYVELIKSQIDVDIPNPRINSLNFDEGVEHVNEEPKNDNC